MANAGRGHRDPILDGLRCRHDWDNSTAMTMPVRMPSGRGTAYLLALALLPWAFDQRAGAGDEGGGLLLQLVALAVSGSFAVLLLLRIDRFRWIAPLAAFVGATALFEGGSLLSSIIGGHGALASFSAAIPVTLLLLFTVIGFAIVQRIGNLEPIVNALVASALFAALVKLAEKLTIGSQSGVVDARYEILPGANTVLLGMMVITLALPVGMIWRGLSLAALLPSFLSATRTVVGSLLVPLALATALKPRRVLAAAAVVLGVIVLAIAIRQLLPDSFVGRMVDFWYFRFFGQNEELGFDLTGEYRRGEVLYMLDQFRSTPGHLLFGNGIAAPTALNELSVRQILIYVGDAADFSMRGFGHNNYVSLLFTGGVMFGGPLLIALAMVAWQSVHTLVRAPALRPNALVLLTLWQAAAALSTLLQSLLSSPMGDRASSVYFGLSIGILIAGRGRLGLATGAQPRISHAGDAAMMAR